jgi:streptogramin lyase
VAWSAGEWNPATCSYDNQQLWTSGGTNANGVDVLLLDGETGAVAEMVNIPEVFFDGYGIYGAAVDGEGNFWGSQLGGGRLVYVNKETFAYKTWEIPISGYGMTVDHEGYVWICSNDVARFDPETETFQTATVGGSGGCMEDGAGTLWLASDALVGVDTTTMQVVKTITIPNYVHGVSIDFYGYVWGVTHSQPDAYRVDPDTSVVDTFTGLTGPYTYSDMTGFALKNAGTIPTPQG